MNENFQITLNILMYFLNFKGIICLMFVITLNFSYFEMFNQLILNWKLPPVTDFTYSFNSSCPDHFQKMFEFNWPGSKEGCDCMDKFNLSGYKENENKTKSGKCNSILKELGCHTVDRTEATYSYEWNNKTVCIRRDNEINYFEFIKNNRIFRMCPTNMQNCGVIDSLGNLLCLEDNLDCPLHMGELSSKIDSHVDLKQQMRIAIEFKVSQGQVCLNKNETNYIDENLFELINMKKTAKCSTKLLYDEHNLISQDTRFQELANLLTSDFYHQQSLLNLTKELSKTKSLPQTYFEHNISLFSRGYIGWDIQCKKEINSMTSIRDIIVKIERGCTFYLIYSLIVLIYCMLFIMIIKEIIEDQFWFEIGILAFYNKIVFVLLYLIISDYMDIVACYKSVETILLKTCSDEQTNLLLKYILASLAEIQKLLNLTIIFYISMFMFSLLKILLTVYKKNKRKIQQLLQEPKANNWIELTLLV